MSKKKLSASINLSTIDKSLLYEGKKGKYLNVTIHWNEEEDKYGNHGFIVQTLPKEKRDAGEKGAIIGNIKELRLESLPESKKEEIKTITTKDWSDDLPF